MYSEYLSQMKLDRRRFKDVQSLLEIDGGLIQQPRKSVHWNARQNPIGNTSSENMVMSSLPVKQALHLWNHLTIHIVFLSIMIVMHSWERTSHKESDDKINQNWPRPKNIPAINNCSSCIMIINGFYSLSGLRLYISSSQMHSRPPTPFHISTLLCHLSSSLRTVAKRKSAASVHPFLRGRYAWMGKVRSNMITLPKSNILHPVYFITNLFLIIIITTIIMMTIFFVIVFILVEHGCRSFRRLLIIIITITTIVNIIALSTAGLLLYKSWLKTKWGRNSSAIHFGNVLNCISSNLSHLIIFHQQESGKKNIKL